MYRRPHHSKYCQAPFAGVVQPLQAYASCYNQAKAAGLVSDIWQMRQIIADSLDLVRYEPQDKAQWDAAYEKYIAITSKQ